MSLSDPGGWSADDRLPDDSDATLTEIFRDTNVVKVQFLASALDDAGVPFTLHETWMENVELGGQEMRLLVREQDIDVAREVILEGVAELPRLRADLEEEFGGDDEPEPGRGFRSTVVPQTFLLIALAGLLMVGLSYLLF